MDTEDEGVSKGAGLWLITAGSTFIGLWESSELLPFTVGPMPARGLLRLATLLVVVCSTDLGEGVAVDMAEQGEEATEFSLLALWQDVATPFFAAFPTSMAES